MCCGVWSVCLSSGDRVAQRCFGTFAKVHIYFIGSRKIIYWERNKFQLIWTKNNNQFINWRQSKSSLLPKKFLKVNSILLFYKLNHYPTAWAIVTSKSHLKMLWIKCWSKGLNSSTSRALCFVIRGEKILNGPVNLYQVWMSKLPVNSVFE